MRINFYGHHWIVLRLCLRLCYKIGLFKSRYIIETETFQATFQYTLDRNYWGA